MNPQTDQEDTTDAPADLAVLTYEECMDLLATQEVGRLAVVVGYYPQIFPVNYRLDDSIVVFRTHLGTKLFAAHLKNVGFEVDHFDPVSRTGWSVLVGGMAEDLQGHPADVITERTRDLGVTSWVGGNQPRFVRIIPASVTGRRIDPRDAGWSTDDRGYL